MPAKVIRHFDGPLERHAAQNGSEASNAVRDRPLTWAAAFTGVQRRPRSFIGVGAMGRPLRLWDNLVDNGQRLLFGVSFKWGIGDRFQGLGLAAEKVARFLGHPRWSAPSQPIDQNRSGPLAP